MAGKKLIRVLFYAVGEPGREMWIEPNLPTFQKLVGGYIESVGLAPNVSIICNEEGLIERLPHNRGGIVGPFFVARFDEEGDEASLTDEDFAKFKDL